MLQRTSLFLLFFLFITTMFAQVNKVKIVEEKIANRLALYALNESETDYDVMITVSGTNFRQSKGKARLVRVPQASKVHLKNLILTKGKFPQYTYELVVNDSLSRRALRKPFTNIKINPKALITIYVPENCPTCDSIINPLNESKYKFTSIVLADRPEVKKGLKMVIPKIDSIYKPIVSLGGKIFPKIESYEQIMEELNKK